MSERLAPLCISRPPGIRFARSKVCSIWVYVLQSHVSSFGVTFQELMMVWHVPRPNSGTLVGSSVGLVVGSWVRFSLGLFEPLITTVLDVWAPE